VKASRRTKSRFSPWRLAKLAVLSAAALVIAWLVVRTAVVNTFVQETPATALAARLAPDDPLVVLSNTMVRVDDSGGRLSPEELARSRAALNGAPLASEPFFAAGLGALASGNNSKASVLLAETLRRDPRSRLTRLILLDRYLRTNQVAKATENITVLAALIPGAGKVMLGELAKFAINPATRGALQTSLEANPAMLQNVMESLASDDADPAIILDLWRHSRALRSIANNGRWQAALVQRMVSQGNVDAAYAAWKSFAPAGAVTDTENLLFDPTFRNAAAPPPFGWRLANKAAGTAEPTDGGAIYLDFFGREKADMMSQLLVLKPGHYLLRFQAEGDAGGEGSRLVWTIDCAPAKQRLLEMPMRGIGSAPKLVETGFVVPADCPAQRLLVQGLPGEFFEGQNATISHLQVVEAHL
jgi:hypothetical protein